MAGYEPWAAYGDQQAGWYIINDVAEMVRMTYLILQICSYFFVLDVDFLLE